MERSLNIAMVGEFDEALTMEYLKEAIRRKVRIEFCAMIGSNVDSERRRLVDERTGGFYKRSTLSDIVGIESIPFHFFTDVNSPRLQTFLGARDTDVIVFGATRIVKWPIWDVPRAGVINCHSGLTQEFRGCSCVEWAILSQRPVGATAHLLVNKIDAGDIISQKRLPILKGQTYPEVRSNMIYHQATVMMDAVERVIANPTGFSQRGSLGPYFKPMRDSEKIAEVISILKDNRYQHYNG